MTRTLAAAAIALGIVAPGATLHAQSEAVALLASLTSLRCTFNVSARTTWKDGVPQPAIRTTTRLVVTMRDINAGSGSALLIRTPINKDLTVVADEKARHFIDAGGGRVTVTTVLGEFSTGMKLKATHSIHDYTALEIASFRSEPEIVMHWGDCEVAPPPS